MGMMKTLLDDDGVVVRFDCPNKVYDNIVERPVGGAAFDFSAEQASKGEDSARTAIECDECHESFTVEAVPSAASLVVHLMFEFRNDGLWMTQDGIREDRAFDRRPPGE